MRDEQEESKVQLTDEKKTWGKSPPQLVMVEDHEVTRNSFLNRLLCTALRWVRVKAVEVFSADLRSLAAFRIVLALLALADLAMRVSDLGAHYTDEGVLPRWVLLQDVLGPWQFSLNLMEGKPFFQTLLFGITALAALMLLVGYRTRLMTFIVWVMLVSIGYRNPLVGASSDTLLRMLFFWGMFLPLGAHWSVDRVLKATPPRLSMRFFSMASVALFAQIAFMYWFTVILKSGPEWRWDGTALYYALGFEQIVTPIGAYLYQFPTLLKVLTFVTLGFEAVGPLLLFFPFLTGPVRTGAVLAFMSFHFGIWLTMDIGLFPWIAALCMVCFLPSWFWDKAVAAFPEQTQVARRWQHTTTHLIHKHWFSVGAWLSTIVSIEQPSIEGARTKGDSNQPQGHTVRMIASSAPLTGGKLWQEESHTATKYASEWEICHDSAAESTFITLRSSLVASLLALFFLLYVFCYNLTTVSSFKIPESIYPVGPLLGLEQHWGMFAPGPSKNDGSFVIPGSLRSGQQLDLMANIIQNDFSMPSAGVSWEKPSHLRSLYRDEHWRKYLEQIRDQKNADQRLYFARYICREWNKRHTGDEELTNFQITFMEVPTLPDYEHATPKKFVLWEHSCF